MSGRSDAVRGVMRMALIISHELPEYSRTFPLMAKQNGAYYYSREIVENIIPNVETDRSWVTINIPGKAASHSIVFIHNNKNPALYDHLRDYKDKVLVCGVPETCEKVAHLGRPIYLPLSVDIEYVEKFRAKEKLYNYAFVGRPSKREGIKFPKGTIFLEGMERTRLLTEMAKAKNVFAVGRCAIEARILDCRVLPYDERFPDPELWQVLDNREAAKILQTKLDLIDKEKEEDADNKKRIH